MSLVTLSRKISFSSGHRYWQADKTAEENARLFGKWASPFNHGHNYVLWVGAAGNVDPATGMVVNIKWIDDLLKRKVITAFDQRSINDEIAAFAKTPPTIENLLLYFSRELLDLPGGARLVSLKLEETPLLYAEYQLEPPMLSLTRVYEFAASHRLNVPELSHEENLKFFGKCNNPNGHGHNYVLEVTVTGNPDPQTGMMTNIDELDLAVHEQVVDRYDHHNLDLDIPEFVGRNTTSEVVAQEIFKRLNGQVPAKLARIRLYETARNMFEVTGI